MPFTGYYEHSIDDKNRLAIPAALRNQMEPERDGKRFHLVPGRRPGSLRLYPETYFRSLSDRLERNLLEHEHQAEFEESLFPFAVLLDMDSAGRVVLPADAIQLAGLGREVTVAGVRDHLEISNREEFNQRKLSAWRNYSANQQRARQSLQQESQGRQTGPVAG